MRPEFSLYTYQSRLSLNPTQESFLTEYAALYGRVERHLYAAKSKGIDARSLKSEYQKRFGVTARQFNAVSRNLDGKIRSLQESQKRRNIHLSNRIKRLSKVVSDLENRFGKTPKQSQVLHQKKRRLSFLQDQHSKLQSDIRSGRTRLCFGSKSLFRAQFNLEANGYESHEEWKQDWIQSRQSQFFVLGSKDETAGCQGCVATLDSETGFQLKLRAPEALVPFFGRHVVLSELSFSYGQEAILEALKENHIRKEWRSKDGQAHHGGAYKHRGRAINYRFLRDQKGWRVFVTVAVSSKPAVTDSDLGCIGVDLNSDHLAICETDRFGNPLSQWRVPLVTYGKSQNQTKALVGDAVSKLVEAAKKVGKPIVREQLDFEKKKEALKANQDARYARMLSSLSYHHTFQALESKAFREGVEVFEVNPAYSSVIGRCKFAKSYGMTVHQAAALVIARRKMKFSEQPPRQLKDIPADQEGYLTLKVPVRNPSRHVWSFWSGVLRNFKTVHAAHNRLLRKKISLSKKVLTSLDM